MILSETSAPPYRYRYGSSALVVSMPHVGTFIPAHIGGALDDVAALRPDTDWHLPRLYDFLGELDATVIAASCSRYVIDLNRPPDDADLYPGKDTTGLCPVDTFDKRALYREGRAPAAAEIAARTQRYWQPYHRRIAGELDRVRARHGAAILWDAHSIVSMAPRFFEGRLPDFNLGTGGGQTCAPELAQRLLASLKRYSSFAAVLDGRFKGGYITRHYGDPARNVHAIQMEMAQAIYMDEHPPFAFRDDRAARVRPILREQLDIALDWARAP